MILWEGFNIEEMEGHQPKVDPNESGSLERFDFVRCYVDEEVSLESAEEAEPWLGWGCKTILIDTTKRQINEDSFPSFLFFPKYHDF